MSTDVILCYVRHEAAPNLSEEDEEKEELDQGPRSCYYLGGLLIQKHCYGNPVTAKGYLPARSEEMRLLDLVAQWAPERVEDVARGAVGHLIVPLWMELEGEDPVRYLEVESDVDGADDLFSSWFLPSEEDAVQGPEQDLSKQ